MTDIGHPARAETPWRRLWQRFEAWRIDKIASPEFQSWAAAFPLTRPFVRRDSAQLYDLVAGFVYSQVLLACTELGVLESLRRGPATARALGARHGLAEERMATLCQAAAALGLMVRRRDGSYRLGRLGAAAQGVPGLGDMIRHHATFYRDLRDPVALLRGEAETELSRFWPYVHGAAAAEDARTAETYSDLMATSQHLVAEETLDALALTGITHLADIGGGTGVFLEHVARRHADLRLTLFDLPAVAQAARTRLGGTPVADRIAVVGGSFLDDPLPTGADALSLIRVLYDHDDRTVHALLARVFAALPPGGRLILSEPMSGGATPNRAGDAYFGFYTMAMTTGRPRSAERHGALLREAGFTNIRAHRTRRPFLTSVLTADRPATI